jgi:hypothetical protein
VPDSDLIAINANGRQLVLAKHPSSPGDQPLYVVASE